MLHWMMNIIHVIKQWDNSDEVPAEDIDFLNIK